MTCYTKENKTKIVNQSRTVAASIAVASKLTSDVVLRGDILEVNFRSNRESNSSKTFAAAKEFAGRFKKHYKGTNISTDSRDVDNSSYAVLLLTDNEVDRLSNKSQLSKASSDNQVLESEFREIADKLTAKTGIKYEILSPKETLERLAKNGRDISEFTEDTAPAFFTKDSIVFPSNKLTADTAFHEFAHPFVDAITNTNKTLFNTLKSQLKNSPSGVEIIDYVKELYSELLDEKGELTEMGWKEVITQALGELANNNLNQSKDKGLIAALKNLLEKISEYLSSLISNENKTIKPIKLKANTTLEELAIMLNLDNKIELKTPNENEVQYTLKAVNILMSDKAQQVFDKGKKNKWTLDKILSELGIPKEQKVLILDIDLKSEIKTKEGLNPWDDNANYKVELTRDELALELANQISYTVEINTTKETQTKYNSKDIEFDANNNIYKYYSDRDVYLVFHHIDDGGGKSEITKEEFYRIYNQKLPNTKHYSNLTVPGGTNYTENEISTPLITPSIKGHAAFSTAQGIGWFRNDEQKFNSLELSRLHNEGKFKSLEEEEEFEKKSTKTRRILEVQSDLFQKGRDLSNLEGGKKKIHRDYEVRDNAYGNKNEFPFIIVNPEDGEVYDFYKTREEATKAAYGETEDSNKNKFLQLLNKDNNWVTFFVKSIIQDSAKKGYEKVLFPKGETAAKIEGHETLSNEINSINKQIEEYENKESKRDKSEPLEDDSHNYSKSIEELEKRKSDLKSQGIEKLKPIEAFYEVRIGNVLKKLGEVNTITDEYGNEWYEIMPSDLDIQLSKRNPNTQQDETKSEPKPFSKQQQSLTNRLKTLTRDLSNYTKTDPRYADKYAHIIKLKDRLKDLAENPTEAGYEEVGRDLIKDAMEYVTKLKTGEYSETKDKWLNSIADIIDTWKDFPELETEVGRLKRNFFGLFDSNIVDKVNSHTTEKTPVTLEKIDAQNEDVSLWTGGTGSLADLTNYIAKTIGLEIKSSQNKIARQNIIDTKKIQAEVDALNEYASKNGLDMESVWDDLIEDHKGGTVLVKRYNKDGTENEKYTKIMSTPGLEKFYTFYQEMIVDKQSITSYTEGGKYFIPNLAKISTKNSLKKANPFKTRKLGQSFEEDMSLDVVPLKFIDKIDSADKNRDLGYALLAFSQHANQYSEMSDILPGLRLMQEYLKYNKESPTKQKQFKSSVNSNKLINADQTNLWKMIDTIINMQVIGKMKIDEAHFVYGTKIDENGDLVQKYIDFRQVGDSLLRWNSLLRIGFNPTSAFANVMFGDITNTLEAVGGRFFSYKNLLQASKIFANQVGKKDSVLNTVLHPELNFLQELDDYTYLEEVRSTGKKKGLTGAKLEEYAYSMQKGGENWIQSRVALGIMIKDEYIDSNGVLTEKYTKASDKEKQALTDKIQRVNHMNHGRYTTKESAAWQQNILFRMVSQFRKYIPAAIENRIGAHNPHDNRLGVETEGRYRTLGREVLKEGLTNPIQALENLFLPIISAKKALEKGNLTEMEIYNMRKMMIEIIMATASIVAFAGLTSGSDEDRKRRMRNPFVKFILTMLNRMSGDLTYFYDPANITTFSKTAIPMTKLLTDLGNTITYAIKGYPFYAGDWEIEHGSFKNRNKFYKTVSGITPGAKSVQDIWRMTNDQALEEFNAK